MGEHDIIYKELFSDKGIVSDLLRGFLSPETVKHISFDTLTKPNSDYTNNKLKTRSDDIVWKVKYRGNWFYLYVIFEFQSTPDNSMPVRMLSYVSLLYEDLIKSNEVSLADGKKLPPILPILIYDGSKNWGAATNIKNIIVKTSNELERYMPSMEYLLINIGVIKQEIINELPTSVASIFEIARIEELDHISYVYEKYRDWLLHPNQNRIRRIFIMFFNRMLRSLHVDGSEFKEIRELEEVGSMLCDIDTWPEKWMQMGMDKMSGKIKIIQQENKKKLMQLQLEKEEAIRQQQQQSKENTAIAMLKDGLPHEAIAKYTDLTLKEIAELTKDN